MFKKYMLELNYKEILLLNGEVRPEVQEIIDRIIEEEKNSKGFSLAIMNELLQKAQEKEELTWRYKQIRSCPCCDKKYDYHKYQRNSRYHKKGDNNYDSPIYYGGYKFFEGFITVQGVGDICCDCEKEHNVINTLIDYIIDNDLKIQIQKNSYKFTKYIKDTIVICPHCSEKIKSSEIIKETNRWGSVIGYKCPHCKEISTYKNNFRETKEHTMSLNPAFGQEVVLNKVKEIIDNYNKDIDNYDRDSIYSFNSNQDEHTYIIEHKNSYNRTFLIKFNIASKKFTSNTNGIFENYKFREDLLLDLGYLKIEKK